MIEIYIEHWSHGDIVQHPWSVWVDGQQLASSHGRQEYASRDISETAARQFCKKMLSKPPDRVNRL